MTRVELESSDDEILLAVRAYAGARQNAVTGVREGRLCVSVTQAPERGKANKAIAKLLAKLLGLRPSQVELIAGATGPHKRFLVHGVDSDGLLKRIDGLLQ